jgi:hypothetical protein
VRLLSKLALQNPFSALARGPDACRLLLASHHINHGYLPPCSP